MIDFLHELFARFDLLETIISNNGTQFSSKDFENFYKIYLILNTPPHHPSSNGMSERFVDVFKRAIKKASETETVNEELQKFMSMYRIIPDVNASSRTAPAKLIFARKIRSIINKLKPTEKKMDGRKKYQW